MDVLIAIVHSTLQIGMKRESQVQDTYRYNDKNIHTLHFVCVFLSYRYNDKNTDFQVQCSYHYNDKKINTFLFLLR